MELHDDTIQVITAALVTIDRITPAIRAHDTKRIAEVLPPTRTMLADAVERVRRLTFELHPPLLEAHGLPVALTDLIDRAARGANVATDVVVEVGRIPSPWRTSRIGSSGRRSPTRGATPGRPAWRSTSASTGEPCTGACGTTASAIRGDGRTIGRASYGTSASSDWPSACGWPTAISTSAP